MTNPTRSEPDRGAALLLALVFLLALGLVLGSIATFARGAVANTINLTTERTAELNASNAMASAIENVRRSYDPGIYTTTTTDCLPNGTRIPASTLPDGTEVAADPFYVYCTGTDYAGLRQVEFYACASSTPCVDAPSGVALYAVVDYDDVPPGATPAGYYACGPSATSTCGTQMQIVIWDLEVAQS